MTTHIGRPDAFQVPILSFLVILFVAVASCALAPTKSAAALVPPRIYMYRVAFGCSFEDVPSNVAATAFASSRFDAHSLFQWHRHIVASGLVIADASNATLFYVPLLPNVFWRHNTSPDDTLQQSRGPIPWVTSGAEHCARLALRQLRSSQSFYRLDRRDHLVISSGFDEARSLFRGALGSLLHVIVAPGSTRKALRRICSHRMPSSHFVVVPAFEGDALLSLSSQVARARAHRRPWPRRTLLSHSASSQNGASPALHAALRRIATRRATSVAIESSFRPSLQNARPVIMRLEIQNLTQRRHIEDGFCSASAAFESLCSWKQVRRQSPSMVHTENDAIACGRNESSRHNGWSDSEFCLIIQGEDDSCLHAMLSAGCIPVLVYPLAQDALAHLPLSMLLPWHSFVIFHELNSAQEELSPDRWGHLPRFAHGLLEHLLSISAYRLEQKRRAWLHYAQRLTWDHSLNSSGSIVFTSPYSRVRSAAELMARELALRAVVGPSWRRLLDLRGPHVVVANPSDLKVKSSYREALITRALPRLQFEPRLAIIAFSDRPVVRSLTRPSLERFRLSHKGRYDLLLYDEPLLDSRDFHPAWNKLAFARRALVLGAYDAVVCMDDDIFIMNHSLDPISATISKHLLGRDSVAVALASADTHSDLSRVPVNTGVLAFRRGPATLHLIDELFRLGRRLTLLDTGYAWLPRITGLWDQDALADYIKLHGQSAIAVVPHGELQSMVHMQMQPSTSKIFSVASFSTWRRGNFAAHITTSGPELTFGQRAELLYRFQREFAAVFHDK